MIVPHDMLPESGDLVAAISHQKDVLADCVVGLLGKGDAVYVPVGSTALVTAVDTRSEQQQKVDRRSHVKPPFASWVIAPIFDSAEAKRIEARRGELEACLTRSVDKLPESDPPGAKAAIAQWKNKVSSPAAPAV